ncbi:Xylose isomerase-like TIM barrel [Planctopirus ephydatiae]|jgi:sugar phosphate isomerase/epimerase|uniref:Xylose isomerase-like TIM barrel n=1 Tax=Planctopirus ephydatiae TaxID=2528019 RepID=A0A518GMI7_9PLAN|nr:TIM barrel protein [Planctopirus ephydatiae]QDV29853.1 Xylose isomerase-like TIM barrel [Planctopirus ephydatiae]
MNRRNFLSTSGSAALAAGLFSLPAASAEQVKSGHPHSDKLGWKISVQHWAYRRVPLFEGLEMAAKVGLRYFEPRSILQLDARRPGVNADENMPEEARKELKSRANDLGIDFLSTFADFNGKPDQARRMLEFWKSLGVEVVVTEPSPKTLDMLEPLFAEYGMQLALHNHQRGKSEYWHPDIVLDHCKRRGRQIGACCDVGQWTRSDLKPVDCLRKIGIERMTSFHLKDVLTVGDLDCRNTVIGEGAADCANCLKEIHTLGYRALVTIDFEHDSPALQHDMVKNIAFIEEQARLLT